LIASTKHRTAEVLAGLIQTTLDTIEHITKQTHTTFKRLKNSLWKS
jgi:hypothetical protein